MNTGFTEEEKKDFLGQNISFQIVYLVKKYPGKCITFYNQLHHELAGISGCGYYSRVVCKLIKEGILTASYHNRAKYIDLVSYSFDVDSLRTKERDQSSWDLIGEDGSYEW